MAFGEGPLRLPLLVEAAEELFVPVAIRNNVEAYIEFANDVEARTGDMNYVYKKYNTTDEAFAAEDLCRGLPFGEELGELLRVFREGDDSEEYRLAKDADQLDLLCNLVTERDRGNRQADDSNPKGYFEHDKATRLVARVLVDHKQRDEGRLPKFSLRTRSRLHGLTA